MPSGNWTATSQLDAIDADDDLAQPVLGSTPLTDVPEEEEEGAEW